MTEEELEDWVNKNPMIANAVYPACIVIGALILQVASISVNFVDVIYTFILGERNVR